MFQVTCWRESVMDCHPRGPLSNDLPRQLLSRWHYEYYLVPTEVRNLPKKPALPLKLSPMPESCSRPTALQGKLLENKSRLLLLRSLWAMVRVIVAQTPTSTIKGSHYQSDFVHTSTAASLVINTRYVQLLFICTEHIPCRNKSYCG